MFWEKYKVISKDKKWDSYLFGKKLWFEERAFKFKNKHYNLYAPYAFSGGGHDLKSKHQIQMRRLYLIELD